MELVQVGWANHCTQMALLRAVFLYLDTAYVRSTPGTQPLWYVAGASAVSAALPLLYAFRCATSDMGVALFREHLLSTGDSLGRVVRSFVSCVALDREGQAVDRGTLAAVQRMFSQLRVYSSHLEPAVLASSASFFDAEGAALMGAGDVPGFLRRVDDWLRAEVCKGRVV